MLNASICRAFAEEVEAFAETEGVTTIARSATAAGPGQGAPAVFSVSLRRFLEADLLQGEMFGPAALIVRGSIGEIEAGQKWSHLCGASLVRFINLVFWKPAAAL